MRALSGREQAMVETWNAHTAAEFELKDADAALAVMTDDPALLHVPIGAGASGREALRAFYADVFIPNVPDDIELELLTRTVSIDDGRIVEEFILHLTHSMQMDWFVPGVAATGRTLAVPHVGVIAFDGDKISSEHIYWDQGTVLRQLGILGDGAPVLDAAEAPSRLRDPNAPANEMIARLSQR